jgi:hypothetical protein
MAAMRAYNRLHWQRRLQKQEVVSFPSLVAS